MTRIADLTSIASAFVSRYNGWCTATFLLLDDITIPPRSMIALELLNVFFTRPYKLTMSIRKRLHELQPRIYTFLPLTTSPNAAKLQFVIEMLVPELFNSDTELYRYLSHVAQGRIRTLVCQYLMGESYYLWKPMWSKILRRIPLHKPTHVSQDHLQRLWRCRGMACSDTTASGVVKLLPAVTGGTQWSRDDIPWMYRKYFRELKAEQELLSVA